jgi:fused signal recognition particle receptor
MPIKSTAVNTDMAPGEIRFESVDQIVTDQISIGIENSRLLEEMKKIARVAKPDLTILVADALTGNDAVEQAQKFSEAIHIDGVIITKLDADVKGGSAVSMAAAPS